MAGYTSPTTLGKRNMNLPLLGLVAAGLLSSCSHPPKYDWAAENCRAGEAYGACLDRVQAADMQEHESLMLRDQAVAKEVARKAADPVYQAQIRKAEQDARRAEADARRAEADRLECKLRAQETMARVGGIGLLAMAYGNQTYDLCVQAASARRATY